jgi:hypothetical protein
MTLRKRLCGSILALLFAATAAHSQSKPKPAAAPPIPRLEKRSGVTHLIVDGKPWLALAGELLNNTASTAQNVRPLWPSLAKINMNTVLVGVGWSWIEPEEDKFDFSSIDGVLHDARKNGLRLVLLWFGSWKNGTSSYVPAWVKKDFERFPIVRDRNGTGREILTAISDVNSNADAKAFSALMRHLREVDSQTRTALMIQVENEVGVLGLSRDFSPAANELFAKPVPKQLMDYLEKNRDGLIPEFRKVWDAAGGRTSGTWEEVFGKGTAADEVFSAWHYARYLNRIAEAGKKDYPLPMFVNAWLVQPQDKQPGDYPSGGPQDHMHDIWRAGAPAIDFLAPDIYLPNFSEIARNYSRGGNPLFIPETRADPVNALTAIAQFNAQMFSPFGVDRQLDPESPLARTYGMLGQLAPLILESQGKGTMKLIVLEQGGPSQRVTLGDYILTAAMPSGGRGGAPPAVTAAPPGGGPGNAGRGPVPNRGIGLFLQAGPDDFWIAGTGLTITAESTDAATPLASLASVQEGEFKDGRWVIGRWLAGDDTGQGGGQRAVLRLPAGNRMGILKVKYYRYR